MTDHPAKMYGQQGWRVSSAAAKGLPLLFLVLVMVLASCGGNTTTQKKTGSSVLRVVAAPGQGDPDNFNPFYNTNAGGAWGAQGLLYETLYFVNAYTGKETPWLASSYDHSSDLSSLTFHLRPGVKWSDGQALTSDDVVFTFNLMKQNKALDSGSIWSTMLDDVSAPDAQTVTFKLKQPNSTALYMLGGQVFIVPKHAWQNIGDPTKYTNDTPVGTGPYTLSSHSAQVIKYAKNPNFWGTKPAVDQVQVLTAADNSSAALMIAKGQIDWLGSGWDPNLDKQFADKDPQHNHHWFAPSNTVMLYMNLQKPPFDQLAVRKAISLAIDRDQLQKVAAPYAPPANPAGVLLPNSKDWLASDYADAKFTVNKQQAESLLQSAGYTRGGDGIYADKSGKKLSFTMMDVNGWTDWVSDTSLIQNDLKQIGIDVKINTVGGYTPYFSALQSGNYDAAISWTNQGPTPYYPFSGMLNSANSAAPGKPISGTNFERWSNQATDDLLKQYATSSDVNAQKQAVQGLEKIMVDQLPAIPLTYNPFWYEYTTNHFTGWPDANNAYDVGAPFVFPDNENVILHLQPAS